MANLLLEIYPDVWINILTLNALIYKEDSTTMCLGDGTTYSIPEVNICLSEYIDQFKDSFRFTALTGESIILYQPDYLLYTLSSRQDHFIVNKLFLKGGLTYDTKDILMFPISWNLLLKDKAFSLIDRLN